MKICFFGTYNAQYARNVCLRDGLQEIGVKVQEINKIVPKERLEASADFSLFKTISRIYTKIKTSIWLLRQSKSLISCDAIIVLFPGNLDLPVAWLISRLLRKKLVFDTSISLYDTMIIDKKMAQKNSIKARLLKLFEGFLLYLPDTVFVDTIQMKEFIIREFGISQTKIFVVPIGASNKVYFPKTIQKKDKTTQVFFFGMYNPLQGATYIIRAIKLLQKQPHLHFTLLGDGVFRQQILDYAEKHTLKNVTFVGFIPEQKLVAYIQKSDIVLGVFSNSNIGRRVIPNKIFAALACAKPLITAKLPAVEAYLHHKDEVYYCEPENPGSLASAIKSLVSDTATRQRITTKGYEIYKKYFSPKQVARAFMEGYEKTT